MDDVSEYEITDALDVGFSGFSFSNDTNDIVDFQLVFIIKPLDILNASQENVKSCPLFGEVTDGEAVLEQLSRKRLTERGGFKVWIKFEQWACDDDEDDDDD